TSRGAGAMAHWEEVLDEIVRTRRRALVGYAYLLTGDVPAAEDLVQDALYRTFRTGRAATDFALAESLRAARRPHGLPRRHPPAPALGRGAAPARRARHERPGRARGRGAGRRRRGARGPVPPGARVRRAPVLLRPARPGRRGAPRAERGHRQAVPQRREREARGAPRPAPPGRGRRPARRTGATVDRTHPRVVVPARPADPASPDDPARCAM